MHYDNLINANDKLKPMISELNQKINTGVLQPHPLKRILSRDSERKTSKEKGVD